MPELLKGWTSWSVCDHLRQGKVTFPFTRSFLTYSTVQQTLHVQWLCVMFLAWAIIYLLGYFATSYFSRAIQLYTMVALSYPEVRLFKIDSLLVLFPSLPLDQEWWFHMTSALQVWLKLALNLEIEWTSSCSKMTLSKNFAKWIWQSLLIAL